MRRSQQTRRGFLKRCAVTGIGLAAPSFVPSHVLASDERPGANDRIGVGYIGVGRRGQQLMGLPKEARIVAVSDVYRDRAESVAAGRRCRAYTDYRKMLEATDVDAVIVATPDHWHTLPCIHACQAGKDIYCEKPLTLTIHEGQLLVQAVRKYGRVLQTGSQQRSMAANRRGCELVRNNRIGRVHTVIGYNYPSPWNCALPEQPVPQGLDWDRWCGQTQVVPYHKDIFAPRARPGWISFRPWSGGEMTGWGAHGLDQIQWALGTDRTGPVEIWTEGAPFNPPTYEEPGPISQGNAICSRPLVRFRYANGVVLKLDDRAPRGGAVFLGEKGRVTITRGRYTIEPKELDEEPFQDTDLRLYVSNDHMQNWIDCIKTRRLPVADVEIGHRSATLCHLGNIARWLNRPLRWDPVKEVFPGDDEANALCRRPQRKPYALPETV